MCIERRNNKRRCLVAQPLSICMARLAAASTSRRWSEYLLVDSSCTLMGKKARCRKKAICWIM